MLLCKIRVDGGNAHLSGEEDCPRVLKEDEEVARLVGGREQRDEVRHAEQRDDDEERLGRLQMLVVLRLGVVRPQLATHHLQGREGTNEAIDSFLRTTRPTPGPSPTHSLLTIYKLNV